VGKSVDYSKIKAMAESILECIGDYSEGEDPSLPDQDNSINDGGQDELYKTAPSGDATEEGSADGKKKKMAMMSQLLANKFKK